MKIIISEIKNAFKKVSATLRISQRQSLKLMDKEKKKEWGKNERNNQELWNNIKWSSIHVRPRRSRKREQGRRNIKRENDRNCPQSNKRQQIADSKDSKNPKENKDQYV